MAQQLSLCRCSLSHHLYQHRWACYRRWCLPKGHSVSSPSIANIVDFLLFLRNERRLSVSAVKCYRSTLASVFKYKLPELRDSFVLNDLIRSFETERPLHPVSPPSWDLVKVLNYLQGYSFEPLHWKPLRVVTMKTLFLPYLWEISLRSGCYVLFGFTDFSCSYCFLGSSSLFFVRVSSLSFEVPFKERALVFFRHVIPSAGALRDDQPSFPRAHSIRGVATSAAFLCN